MAKEIAYVSFFMSNGEVFEGEYNSECFEGVFEAIRIAMKRGCLLEEDEEVSLELKDTNNNYFHAINGAMIMAIQWN